MVHYGMLGDTMEAWRPCMNLGGTVCGLNKLWEVEGHCGRLVGTVGGWGDCGV